MTNTDLKSLWLGGLWKNNSGFVQLLGLCPLLAVSTTLAYGLGLGIATLLVLISSNVLISLCRNMLGPHVRIPVFVLIIAGLVTAVDLIMNAWFFDLHRVLGIFVPLIVTNCAIIARAELIASRHSLIPAAVDGLSQGIGFAIALALMGFARELIGNGTLFAHMDTLFGDVAANWTIHVGPGLLAFVLPPGAFLMLGLLVAGHKAIQIKKDQSSTESDSASLPASE